MKPMMCRSVRPTVVLLVLAGFVMVSACESKGGSSTDASDAAGQDVTAADSAASDIGSPEDTATPDSAMEDSAVADTLAPDTTSTDSGNGGAGCALAGANGIAASVDGTSYSYTDFPGAVGAVSAGYVRISAGVAEQWQLNFPDSVGTHACDHGTGTDSTFVQLSRAASPVGNTADSGASCTIQVTVTQGTLVGTFNATFPDAIATGTTHTVTSGCFRVPR